MPEEEDEAREVHPVQFGGGDFLKAADRDFRPRVVKSDDPAFVTGEGEAPIVISVDGIGELGGDGEKEYHLPPDDQTPLVEGGMVRAQPDGTEVAVSEGDAFEPITVETTTGDPDVPVKPTDSTNLLKRKVKDQPQA